jgi:DHA1 family inner membrane transport protein
LEETQLPKLAHRSCLAAFNLGNAIGVWLGGMGINPGPGLGAETWVAALLPVLGLAVALWSVRLDTRRPRRAPVLVCAETTL